MPGNEVGDRVHNFFDQGSLSQDQRHTQLVDGNWPALNNNLWGRNERQIGGPLNSNSKNYNAQQSDVDRGLGNQFSLGSHGLNFAQSNLRPEFVKNPTQLQQLNLNGFTHASQVVHARQNEANFLGMDTEPDRQNLTSKSLYTPESQQRSDLHQSNSTSFRGSQSPMNFNFFAGQQQMTGQQPGTLQSLAWQQSAVNDAQLLQQQVMLKQMQELQRQQQFQQLDAMQRSMGGQMASFQNQMSGHHSLAINGNPMHDASNYPRVSHVMAGNTNWLQRGPSAMQGFSNGLMITPEQGQALRFMGMIPQQAPQSLYGVPVTSTHNVDGFSRNNIDKSGMTQVPGPSGSFTGNQYAPLSEQVSMQNETAVSRPGSAGKSSFEHASRQGLGNVVNLGSFNHWQQRNVSVSEGGRQDSASGSEILPDESVTQAVSSQAAVALDPTEEKILFGNDDNIWEAFGGTSVTGTGGVNRLDSTDLFNGFPSVQSGTWSALMQSAVAEASSTDVGTQEEWSGVGSQDSRSQVGNQQSLAIHDSEKQQPNWVSNSQRASLIHQPATNNGSTHSANINSNYLNSSGSQKPFASHNRESFQTGSQIPPEGRKWSGNNMPRQHSEENWAPVIANSSREDSKANSASWSQQQSSFSHNNIGQPSNKVSPLNFIESLPANGSVMSANQGEVQDKGQNQHIFVDTGRSSVEPESVSNSNINMEANHESSRKLPNDHQLDLWKTANMTVKPGMEGSAEDLQKVNSGPPILESSVTMHDGGAEEMQEAENGDGRESHDSRGNSFPHPVPVRGSGENVWSDAGDRCGMHGGREKPSGQTGARVPATRKFQYHPMGDLDMDGDSSFAAKSVLYSQPLPSNFSSAIKGHDLPGRFLGPLSTNSMDTVKGHVSNFHGASQTSPGVLSMGGLSGHLPNTSSTYVKSSEASSPNQHGSSQHMLELLHKVDQSTEQTAVSHLSSTDCSRSSDIASGGHIGLNQSHSSSSHGFNLQLAPPSEGIMRSNLIAAPQNFSRTIESPNSGPVPVIGDKGHAWLTSVSSAPCPPKLESENNKSGVLRTTDAGGLEQNLKGNFSSSSPGPPYLRNTFQNQNMSAANANHSSLPSDRHAYPGHQINDSQDQATVSQSVSNSLNILASGRGMNQFGFKASGRQMPVSSAAVMPGMFRKDNLSPLGATMWNPQQQQLVVQARIASDLPQSLSQTNNSSKTSSFDRPKIDELVDPRRADVFNSQGIPGGKEPLVSEARHAGKTAGASQEEESAKSDASPANSAASQKDVEAVDHPSNSITAARNNYSLLHQMQAIQAMKSMTSDPSYRESKRLKGTDSIPDIRPIPGMAAPNLADGQNNVIRDPSISQTSGAAGDARMLSFSPQLANKNTAFQSPHGVFTPRDMLLFNHSDPQKPASGSVAARVEHTGVSPQMAPSWFEQYGTFKNGQLLPVNNVPRMPMVKNFDQLSNSGKAPANVAVNNSVQLAGVMSDSGQADNNCQITKAYVPRERVSSLDALVPHASATNTAAFRPKKRKIATSDLLPWNKEIDQGFKRVQNMSSAEMDWAQSSNRLIEKVQDETDSPEDLVPMVRQKRRLILTTQLLQQVFRPPSLAVLSLDASSNHEIIAYTLARLALGDACNLICCLEGDSPVHVGTGNIVSRNDQTSERIRDQYFSKVVEEFTNRAKEMEDDLLRLDKRASILDFRLDCQDLERFSVINRFARFHGRGQVDGAESSSSSDATACVQRPCPQRYVSAHPMPRTVPERVQCLSL